MCHQNRKPLHGVPPTMKTTRFFNQVSIATAKRVKKTEFPGCLACSYARLLSKALSTATKGTIARRIPVDGITLSDFITPNISNRRDELLSEDNELGATPIPLSIADEFDDVDGSIRPKLLQKHALNPEPTPHNHPLGLKFHLKTYGCQMNVNDSDIVRSILTKHRVGDGVDSQLKGVTFEETQDEMNADILLINTCAIRDHAEAKIWHRLKELRAHDAKFPLTSSSSLFTTQPRSEHKSRRRRRIIGVLGCMAERLKEDMFKDGTADLVVGPDAYRDLPRLVLSLIPSQVRMERAVNVQLSFDETYADIKPVRSNPGDVSAFVSVMRGCNNMCSYCVVPFTRGRERSRELDSIVNESRKLFEEDHVKEIVLLGQNVNSYHDQSQSAIVTNSSTVEMYQTSNSGFTNLYRLRGGAGFYFSDLVEAVSEISPELRVRFTSPHPKDYPPELLSLMSERHNVCKHLHMPAQSGSTSVLQRMRRGYSREAYIQLIEDVRAAIPDVAISSDFITGFCGETEEEHQETISLMDWVKYDQAYLFAYSMRPKTHAHRTMNDDITDEVKARRLQEIIAAFRTNVQLRNDSTEVGRLRLVLVEGESKKSNPGSRRWGGRTDQNKRITFQVRENDPKCWDEHAMRDILNVLGQEGDRPAKKTSLMHELVSQPKVSLRVGDYAVVQVTEARGHTLKGILLWRATMKGFDEMQIDGGDVNSFFTF